MKFRGGEFSTGTKGNFQSELTLNSNKNRYLEVFAACAMVRKQMKTSFAVVLRD